MGDNSVPSSSPFLAILRFAHVCDAAGQSDVFAFIRARASALRSKDPEETTQVILFKMFRSSDRALIFLRQLASKNLQLHDVLSRLTAAEMPQLDPAFISECDKQLSGYVGRMVRNCEIDRFRKQRHTSPLPDDDVLGAGNHQLDDEGDVLKLGSMALANALKNDAPEWLPATFEEIQTLAEGSRTMDELTAECASSDPELAAMVPAAARVRARNRIQKRHQRAREQVLISIRSMVTSGEFTADEGRGAERWLTLLMRRQNRRSGASQRRKHEE